MSWRNNPLFWRIAAYLFVVWSLGLMERVISISEGVAVPYWVGDAAGLVAAMVLGYAGRRELRGVDIPENVRWILFIAWILFTSYCVSDLLDEFAFPPDNPFLGKRQLLHRAIEIMMWSAGFVLLVAGLFAAILDTDSARREARTERELSDESRRERARTQEQLAIFAAAVDQANESYALMRLDGTVVYANRAFEDMLRIPHGSAVGRTAAELIGTHAASPADMFEDALR